jgi:hypothetical protein
MLVVLLLLLALIDFIQFVCVPACAKCVGGV